MIFLVIISIALFAGGVIGRLLQSKGKQVKRLSYVQTGTLFLLIFFMGIRIGSDDKIFESIKSIGVSAVVVTITTIVGSILAVYALRMCLKLDKRGDKSYD